MDKLNTTDISIDGEIPSDPRSRGTELSIIIVDYKSQKFSLPLVFDLQKRLKHLKFEIIVVDNDPESDLRSVIASHQPLAEARQSNLKIIKAEKNKGYGSGNNLGAKQASGEYLLLLNPDTEIVDNAIEKMLDFLSKHSEVGALTPLIYHPDGQLQRAFFADFQSLAGITIKRWHGKNVSSFLRPVSTRSIRGGRQESTNSDFFYSDMITGAALMIKRDLYEKIGGFDENFFMYIEDDDLCRRISDLGYKNAVLTTAKIIHHEGKSSTSYEKKKFYYKSQDYYWQKHYGKFQTVLMKIIRFPYILLQKLK